MNEELILQRLLELTEIMLKQERKLAAMEEKIKQQQNFFVKKLEEIQQKLSDAEKFKNKLR